MGQEAVHGQLRANAKARSQTVVEQLKRRYRLALGLIALASMTTYTVLSVMIASQRSDAPIINVAGRQRMLSQRTTMLALQVHNSDSAASREPLLAQLKDARALFARSHRGLLYGDLELDLPGAPSTAVHALYERPPTNVSERVRKHLGVLDHILTPPRAIPAAILSYLNSNEPRELLKALNTVVSAYEAEGQARVDTLKWVETGILLLTLSLLGAEVVFIFQPMVRKMGALVLETEAQRIDALERESRLRAVLSATDEALIMVSPTGLVLPGWSARASDWFPQITAQKPVSQVLFADADDQASFELALEELLDEVLPEDLLLEQMPQRMQHGPQALALSYRLVKDGEGISSILVSARDITAHLEQERATRHAVELQAVVSHLLRDRVAFENFANETTETVAELSTQCERPLLLRRLHTLKGNLGIYGFGSLANYIHELEGEANELDEETLSERLRELADRWQGELSRLEGLLQQNRRKALQIYPPEYLGLVESLIEGTNPEALLQQVRAWRLEPVQSQLDRLKWQAERLAKQLGKDVEVVVRHHFVRCRMESLKPLWAPLVHVVRNAIDHGIEDPAIRQQTAKPPMGRLVIEATATELGLGLTIADDGAGIDEKKLRAKAAAAGLAPDASLDVLLFTEGLSSRDNTSLVSGRGVGMAAVLEVVRQMNGELTVSTRGGQGTCIELNLPCDSAGCPPEAEIKHQYLSDFRGLISIRPTGT